MDFKIIDVFVKSVRIALILHQSSYHSDPWHNIECNLWPNVVTLIMFLDYLYRSVVDSRSSQTNDR